jgi:hypothetical protein
MEERTKEEIQEATENATLDCFSYVEPSYPEDPVFMSIYAHLRMAYYIIEFEDATEEFNTRLVQKVFESGDKEALITVSKLYSEDVTLDETNVLSTFMKDDNFMKDFLMALPAEILREFVVELRKD